MSRSATPTHVHWLVVSSSSVMSQYKWPDEMPYDSSTPDEPMRVDAVTVPPSIVHPESAIDSHSHPATVPDLAPPAAAAGLPLLARDTASSTDADGAMVLACMDRLHPIARLAACASSRSRCSSGAAAGAGMPCAVMHSRTPNLDACALFT